MQSHEAGDAAPSGAGDEEIDADAPFSKPQPLARERSLRHRTSSEKLKSSLDRGLEPGAFFYHGKIFRFSPRALGVLSADGCTGKIRHPIVWCVLWFDVQPLPFVRCSHGCLLLLLLLAAVTVVLRGCTARAWR